MYKNFGYFTCSTAKGSDGSGVRQLNSKPSNPSNPIQILFIGAPKNTRHNVNFFYIIFSSLWVVSIAILPLARAILLLVTSFEEREVAT